MRARGVWAFLLPSPTPSPSLSAGRLSRPSTPGEKTTPLLSPEATVQRLALQKKKKSGNIFLIISQLAPTVRTVLRRTLSQDLSRS